MAYRVQRNRLLFRPGQETAYPLSRSKVELFTQCPRCFYLDIRMGIRRPPGFPFNLNKAVDEQLKKEFDHYRRLQLPHPVMVEHDLNMVPFQHPDIDRWRAPFQGIRYRHRDLPLELYGAVDDLWEEDQQLVVVDYKATSRQVNDPNALVYPEYGRQLGFYAWLLQQKGFKITDTGYLLYCNALQESSVFEGRLDFEVYLIPVPIEIGWIPETLEEMHNVLLDPKPPSPGDCDYCRYVDKRQQYQV